MSSYAVESSAVEPLASLIAPLFLSLAILVAMAAGGGYLLLHHKQPAAQPPVTAPAQPEFAPLPEPAVEPETAPVVAKKAAGGRLAPPAALPAPLAQTPSVAFDPKALDPKQNTRLKLELDHFPAGMAFTIAMNGKTYFKGSAGDKAQYENLFVPPGVHEFRVTVHGGGVLKASNIVSAEFLANKRMVLKSWTLKSGQWLFGNFAGPRSRRADRCFPQGRGIFPVTEVNTS